MPHGTYQPDRQAWRIEVGPHVLTPDSPGPSGASWQLAGVWALTYGPLGECRYGELGCTADPGLLLDSFPVRLWEYPPYTRDPDFRGVVGVTRGNRTPELGAYTLALVGEGDLDADGLAIYAEYTKVDAGLGLTPKPDETVAAYHERILEPWGDGGWGVRGDGAKLVGRPSGGPVFTPEQVHGYTSSGQQRRDYVTETSASPGDRWRRLYDTRALPLPYAPRRYAPAGTDNLVLPGVVDPAPISAGAAQPETAWSHDHEMPAPVASTAAFAAPTVQTQSYSVSVPISALAVSSAGREGAENADYDLKGLQVVASVSQGPNYFGASALYGDATFDAFYYDFQTSPAQFEVTVTHWISPTATGTDPADALSTVITGRAGLSLIHPLTTVPPTPQTWAVQISPEEDFLSNHYMSLNGGVYYWKVVLTIRTQAWQARYTRKAADARAPYEHAIWENGHWSGTLSLSEPKMIVDKLVLAIPPENYPPGWDAPSVSPPTHQGEVPGLLWPPARVGELYVTEARTIRTHDRQWTEIQTGARQTQRLLPSEARLKTAIDNREGQGGAW